MSRRPAEANKAIRKAWEREQRLVSQGKGTRDWTEEQQRDILDPAKGKAYDENGHAFVGQHMKSVEAYPDFQGNLDNIQFLTEEEHFYGAHKGSWNNPTNGYYDPVSTEFHKFEENELIPCAIIELSNPIITLSGVADGNLEGENEKPNNTLEIAMKEERIEVEKDTLVITNNTLEREQKTIRQKDNWLTRLLGGVKDLGRSIIEHPVEWVSGALSAFVAGNEIKSIMNSRNHKRDESSSVRSSEASKKPSTQEQKSIPDEEPSIPDSTESEETIEHNYPDERSSPKKHKVSKYDRKQNGKTVHVQEYTRGKDKDE